MFDATEMSLGVPKPRKPVKRESQSIGFDVKTTKSAFLDKVDNLLEMLKFVPDYERKIYAGASEADILKAMKQYGETYLDEKKQITPSFGQVTRSMKNGSIRAAGQGRGIEGLQIDADEGAGDFLHIDGYTPKERGLSNGIIPDTLWEETTDLLKTEKRSYYELMMENAPAEMTPKDAYLLMTGMLESRTRVWGTLESIWGRPDQADDQREEIFQTFMQEMATHLEDGQMGFLRFFLDMQQSFNSHVLPMSGGSTEFVQSDADKDALAVFNESLSAKIKDYIGIADLENPTEEELAALTDDQKKAIELWNAWLNGGPYANPSFNTDPMDADWMDNVYDKMQKDVDSVTFANIFGRVISRSEDNQYKTKKTEYEDKVEEERLNEIADQKREAKRKQEEKQLDAKISQKSRQITQQRVGNTARSAGILAPASKASSRGQGYYKSAVAGLAKKAAGGSNAAYSAGRRMAARAGVGFRVPTASATQSRSRSNPRPARATSAVARSASVSRPKSSRSAVAAPSPAAAAPLAGARHAAPSRSAAVPRTASLRRVAASPANSRPAAKPSKWRGKKTAG